MDEIDGDLCNIQDWAGKLPGAVARVAGLLHVAKHRLFELCVDADSMQRAVTLGTLLCSHAKAVFGLMQTDASNSDAKVILKWIMENQIKSFSQREAYDRFKSRFKTVDRAKDALSELSGRHYISEPQTVHTGGRPSVHYNVNPILFK
jgi:replicative DNA helicase